MRHLNPLREQRDRSCDFEARCRASLGVSDTEFRGESSCLGVRDFVLHLDLMVLIQRVRWGSEFLDL